MTEENDDATRIVISDEDIDNLMPHLEKNDRRISNVIWNIFGTVKDEKIKSLCDALAVNTTLQTLGLRHTYLKPEQAVMLAQVLTAENSSLRSLTIMGDWIKLEGANAFAGTIRRNTSLRELSIEIGELAFEWHIHDMVKILMDAMECNVNLFHFNLGLNDMPSTRMINLWTNENKNIHENLIEATIQSEGLFAYILHQTKRVAMTYHCLQSRMDLIVSSLRVRPP